MSDTQTGAATATDETLLAHLAHRLGHGSEDLATEALAFILRNPVAARGMASHAARWCPDLSPTPRFRTQDWLSEDEAVPDLVGVAADGSTPLIVEAKFGAALTPNQPVTYLKRLLPSGEPGLLLFLVPARRRRSIWAEIQHRCEASGLSLAPSNQSFCGAHGPAVVAVTVWPDLLEEIERHLVPLTDHRRTFAELEQLRGLCERADRSVFAPFTTQFLGGDVGKRLQDLDSLLNEAATSLAERGMASTSGLRWSSGQNWFGRYFLFAGWECLLHVNFVRWGTQRDTPLWLRITDKRAATHPGFQDVLSPLAASEPARLLDDDGRRLIPIHLPHGEERDAVFAAIEDQLVEIHGLLASCPPLPSGAPASDEASTDRL